MEMIHPTHDPRHMQVVVLDGDDFTIEEVVAVARYHAKVEFAPEFIERVNKSRATMLILYQSKNILSPNFLKKAVKSPS